MKSHNLERWHLLSRLTVENVQGEREGFGFVYVFRKRSTEEILYVGSTGDLRRRLFGNYIGGVGGKTTRRIHHYLFDRGAITDTEVSWKEVRDYKQEEASLRQHYREQQGRLPLWNMRT